jgi:hypothetical protein
MDYVNIADLLGIVHLTNPVRLVFCLRFMFARPFGHLDRPYDPEYRQNYLRVYCVVADARLPSDLYAFWRHLFGGDASKA